MTPGAVNTDFQEELRLELELLVGKRNSQSTKWIVDKNLGGWGGAKRSISCAKKDMNEDLK